MKIEFGKAAVKIDDQSFAVEQLYYNKVLHAQIHQLVRFFFNMSTERIIERFCHLNPSVDKFKLNEWLPSSNGKFFFTLCKIKTAC